MSCWSRDRGGPCRPLHTRHIARYLNNLTPSPRGPLPPSPRQDVEIYQEQPYDLLATGSGASASSTGATSASVGSRGGNGAGGGFGSGFSAGDEPRKLLRIREDVDSDGFFLEDLTRVTLTSPRQALEVLHSGFMLRRTASTAMNARSSRSHAVLSLSVEVRVTTRDEGAGVSHATSRSGLLDIVDLAGSERQRDTGAEGSTVKEAGKINNSLGCLADVVKTTVDNQMARHSRMTKPVPWRNSRLTMLLKRSLSGNSKTAMIFAISPALEYWAESYNTLLFADRARRLKTEPSSNERTVLMGGTQVQVAHMAKEIAALKAQLARVRGSGAAGADVPASAGASASSTSVLTLADVSTSLSTFAATAAGLACEFSAPPQSGAPDSMSLKIEQHLRGLGDLARVLAEVDSRGAAASAALSALPDTSAAALAQVDARAAEIESESPKSGLAHVAAQLTARVAELETLIAANAEERRARSAEAAPDGEIAEVERPAPRPSDFPGDDFDSSSEIRDYGRLSSGRSSIGSPSAMFGALQPSSSRNPSSSLASLEARLREWRATAAAELASPMSEVLYEAGRKDAALAEYRTAVQGLAAKNSEIERLVCDLRQAFAALSAGAAPGAGACVSILGAAAGLIRDLNTERRRLAGRGAELEAHVRAADKEILALRSQLGGGASMPAQHHSAELGFALGGGGEAQPTADDEAAAGVAVASDGLGFDDEPSSPVDANGATSAAMVLRLTAQTLVAGTVAVDSARGGAGSFLRPFARGASESLRQEKPRVSSLHPAEAVAKLARERTMSISSAPGSVADARDHESVSSPEDAACAYDSENLVGEVSLACRQPASARHSMVSVADSTLSVGTSISGRMEAAERVGVAAAAAAAMAAAEAAAAPLAPAKLVPQAPAQTQAQAPVIKRPLASLIARSK